MKAKQMNQATYSPEDNKLRLYVGRVPREEYLKLRADGWTALHKQREAGQGDFAATWTPSRRDTALEYAGIIEDEDAGPAERAADRAERFGGYRDKRTTDATGHADRYDAQPAAHGFQDVNKAERAVSRHEQIADRASDAWSKAEYWTQRTAGVISHALYKSTPGVRMGRIKTLEAELRKMRAGLEEYAALFHDMQKIAAMTDAEKQTAQALHYAGSRHIWAEYIHPRAADMPEGVYSKTNKVSLYSLLSSETHPITGAQACALFFTDHHEPKGETSWTTHLTLRLAYENQMLAAQGGRLEQCEVLPGGKLGGRLIIKVSKSSVTKRATSCDILGPKVTGWTYKAANIPGTEFAAYKFDLERYSPEAYTPPTPESLAELEAFNTARKANAPKTNKAPLINPTDADAERLQAIWNAKELATLDDYDKKRFEPAEVCRITQATYSAISKGAYAKAETRGLRCLGVLTRPASWNCHSPERDKLEREAGPELCVVRLAAGSKRRVIILTDKPQKPFPAEVWEKYVAPVAKPETDTVCA